MGTADTESPHRSGTVITIAALAAVFGLAALAVVRGLGPVEVTALVVAGTAAAERLVRHCRRNARTRQWGPPAATRDPRPQIAEPSRRPDRELNGRSRDRSVTECGDVTSLLSSHPGPDGGVRPEVRPVTPADAVGDGGTVAAGRRRTARPASTARPTRR